PDDRPMRRRPWPGVLSYRRIDPLKGHRHGQHVESVARLRRRRVVHLGQAPRHLPACGRWRLGAAHEGVARDDQGSGGHRRSHEPRRHLYRHPRRTLSQPQRRGFVGAAGAARTRPGGVVDPRAPPGCATDLRRHLARRRLPQRRRRRHMAAAAPGGPARARGDGLRVPRDGPGRPSRPARDDAGRGARGPDGTGDLVRLAELPHLKSRIVSDTEIEGMLDIHAIALTSAKPGVPYAAIRMGLFQSTDDGAHWKDMQVGRFSPLTYGRDIRVSPQDPRVMYACLSPAARSQDGSLYRSDDVGETWKRFDHGIKAETTMMAVALHPTDADRVYCVSRTGQVFGTEDGGRSWREHRLPDGVEDVYALACA